MSPEEKGDKDEGHYFGDKPDQVVDRIKQMLEKQKPGVDKTAASLYRNLTEAMKAIPSLQGRLDELSQDPKSEHVLEFKVGEQTWKFIANKDGRVGDFRLARGEEEEAMIIIREEADNTFAYWNKKFVPKERKIFRGPNEPAARKIQGMINQLTLKH